MKTHVVMLDRALHKRLKALLGMMRAVTHPEQALKMLLEELSCHDTMVVTTRKKLNRAFPFEIE
tara:strand:- start:6139 stop:6330 length:192 start_codon:yes stop_codon:yes gene_type:complete